MTQKSNFIFKRPGILFPVFLFLLFPEGRCQFVQSSARDLARGDMYAASIPGDHAGINPASLATCKELFMIVGQSMPSMIPGLTVSDFSAAIPAIHGAFGAHLKGYGLPGLWYTEIVTGYGLKTGKNINAGVSFSSRNWSSNGELLYTWEVGISLGMTLVIGNSTATGLIIQDPFSVGNLDPGFRKDRALIAWGISHQIYDNTYGLLEVDVSMQGPTVLKVGLDHVISSGISLRTGYHSGPNTFALGTGFEWGIFTIDLCLEWTPLSGTTPSISLTYLPK